MTRSFMPGWAHVRGLAAAALACTAAVAGVACAGFSDTTPLPDGGIDDFLASEDAGSGMPDGGSPADAGDATPGAGTSTAAGAGLVRLADLRIGSGGLDFCLRLAGASGWTGPILAAHGLPGASPSDGSPPTSRLTAAPRAPRCWSPCAWWTPARPATAPAPSVAQLAESSRAAM